MEQTYLNNLDEDKVKQVLNDTEENVKFFEDIAKQVIESYTKDLDDLMKDIYTDIVDKSHSVVSRETIERYLTKLTLMIYFMGTNLERLGIYGDMSLAAKQEIYNKAYLKAQDEAVANKTKRTVAELTAQAEGSAIYETAVNYIYTRVYKLFKFKIDSAQSTAAMLNKLLSGKYADLQLASQASDRRILNENIN